MKKLLLTLAALAFFAAPVSVLACGTQGNQYRTATGLVTQEEAQQITANYISTIDSSLQVGDVSFDGQSYVVNVMDDQGRLIAKLNIHMLTGEIRAIF